MMMMMVKMMMGLLYLWTAIREHTLRQVSAAAQPRSAFRILSRQDLRLRNPTSKFLYSAGPLM